MWKNLLNNLKKFIVNFKKNKIKGLEFGNKPNDSVAYIGRIRVTPQKSLSIDIEELNNFINLNLRNRKNATNYTLLQDIAKQIFNKIKIPNRYNPDVFIPCTMENTINIALNFFQSVDEDLYNRAKDIILGKSREEFRIYYLEDVQDDTEFDEKREDGLPKYTRNCSVHTTNKEKTVIFVPLKGTSEDIYLLVHELSHTFDLEPKNESHNSTRNLLGEVTPYCFEAMLGDYLLKNHIISEQEILSREKGTFISQFDDAVETYVKLLLMSIKEKNGEITVNDLHQIQQKYRIDDRQLEYIINRFLKAQNNTTVDYRVRYAIALIICSYYMEQYKKDPKKSVGKLKEYFAKIKDNNLNEALETMGLNLEMIDTLIEATNSRINHVQKRIDIDQR